LHIDSESVIFVHQLKQQTTNQVLIDFLKSLLKVSTMNIYKITRTDNHDKFDFGTEYHISAIVYANTEAEAKTVRPRHNEFDYFSDCAYNLTNEDWNSEDNSCWVNSPDLIKVELLESNVEMPVFVHDRITKKLAFNPLIESEFVSMAW